MRHQSEGRDGVRPRPVSGVGSDDLFQFRVRPIRSTLCCAAKPAEFTDVETAADDVCIIAFTSGTTGVPKGTMHFHRDVMAICDCFPRSCLKPLPQDIFCGTPPLAFTFGLGGLLLFPLRFGASTVLLERLTPTTLLSAVEEYRASVCFTAPLSIARWRRWHSTTTFPV